MAGSPVQAIIKKKSPRKDQKEEKKTGGSFFQLNNNVKTGKRKKKSRQGLPRDAGFGSHVLPVMKREREIFTGKGEKKGAVGRTTSRVE